MAPRKPGRRVAPRNYLAPLAEIKAWFDQALRRSDPRPSDAILEQLARELQIMVNRRQNLEGGPLKDVDGNEEIYKRVRKIQEIADDLYSKTIELEDYAPSYVWGFGDKAISLQELQEPLYLVAFAAVPPPPWPSRSSARGRPIEPWHDVARKFARLIKDALEGVGHKHRLSPKDEESMTAVIGAQAITWAYGFQVQPRGFAQAMRDRVRRKVRGIPSLAEAFLRPINDID